MNHHLKEYFLLVFLFHVLTCSASALEEPTQEGFRGVVIDTKSPLKIDGTRKDGNIKLNIRLESKDLCLGQIYLEDIEGNAVMAYEITEPQKPSFSIGFGFGISKGKGPGGDETQSIHRSNPQETYIPKENRVQRGGTTGGGGFGFGIGIPFLGLFKGKQCQREMEASFVLPKGKIEIETWKAVFSLVNPRTREEIFAIHKLSEHKGKIVANP